MNETQAHTTNPIRKRRRNLGLSMRGLAAICGISAPSVYFAEVGRRTLPLKLLRGLCDATGEAYEALLEDWLAWRTEGSAGHADRLEWLIKAASPRVKCDGGKGE